jgi:hypothetical protein
MAQNSSFRLQYIGAVKVQKNKEYIASDFSTLFPSGNMFMLKTKTSDTSPVKVSINNTVAFPIAYGETTAYDGATSLKYVFNKDCIIVICKDMDVA